MIVVDTSVWVDHLRQGDARLGGLLEAGSVLIHPFVVGEIALGSLSDRRQVLRLLQNLPAVTAASHDEVLYFIDSNALFGLGLGHVDIHLLAATQLTPGSTLWTRDARLHCSADRLGLAAGP